MKFEIRCVSGKEPPCVGAFKGKATWTNSYGPQEEDVWFIELDPKHLPTFAKHHGGIILDENCYSERLMAIKIYDGYNE